MGHAVKIIPVQFVKPYVKSNKSDLIDEAAIAEAVTRPSMRFVTPKTKEQVEIQTLHRIRDRLVICKTQLINQIHAFCLEFGIGLRHGVGMFKADFPAALADESNDLTPRMRVLPEGLWTEFGVLESRLAELNKEIEVLAARSEIAHRLASIPGIGPLGATALIAAVGDRKQFRNARDMAAWLDLVPRQYSTGGQDDAAWHEQARKFLCQKTFTSWCSFLRIASEQAKRSVRHLDCGIVYANAHEQSRSCLGQQVGQGCTGCLDTPRKPI
jgi:transposase